MTDGQYGDHLRAVIADLERIKKLRVSKEAEAEIDPIIARYRETIGQARRGLDSAAFFCLAEPR